MPIVYHALAACDVCGKKTEPTSGKSYAENMARSQGWLVATYPHSFELAFLCCDCAANKPKPKWWPKEVQQ
jgi:hypothetical protein